MGAHRSHKHQTLNNRKNVIAKQEPATHTHTNRASGEKCVPGKTFYCFCALHFKSTTNMCLLTTFYCRPLFGGGPPIFRLRIDKRQNANSTTVLSHATAVGGISVEYGVQKLSTIKYKCSFFIFFHYPSKTKGSAKSKWLVTKTKQQKNVIP